MARSLEMSLIYRKEPREEPHIWPGASRGASYMARSLERSLVYGQESREENRLPLFVRSITNYVFKCYRKRIMATSISSYPQPAMDNDVRDGRTN